MSVVERSRYESFVDGSALQRATGDYFPALDPSTGSLLAEVAQATADDVGSAVQSAHQAFELSWAAMDNVERGRILRRIGEVLLLHQDELAMLETLDTGQPLSQAKDDIRVASRFFEYYSGIADKIEGTHIPLGSRNFAITTKEPFGVVGIITPWNAPLNTAARSAAPALAAGNTVVIKPAEDASLSTVRLAELACEVGLPPGVMNVVTGDGEVTGRALVEHSLVRKLSFTGSVETGKIVASLAVERLVPVGLELGGKSPTVVFPDADMDAVTSLAVKTVTHKAGQVCSAATRFLVDVAAVDLVLENLRAAFSRITVGPGIEDPMLGPLISSSQLARVLTYMRNGADGGATVVVGGDRYETDRLKDGFFVQPTLFTNVTQDMGIAREEIFGPVVVVMPFENEEQAIRLANDSDYGLVAGVFTRDIERAFRVAQQLDAGQVFINDFQSGGVETPFGGFKQSGWGREKGLEAINHYTQLKSTVVAI